MASKILARAESSSDGCSVAWHCNATLGLCLLLFLNGCATDVGAGGTYPRTVFTDTRTTVVLDGQTHVIEGTTRCGRTGNFDSDGDLRGFVDSAGPRYRCEPKWLGHRLRDGSALIVGSFSYTGKWSDAGDPVEADLVKYKGLVANVPRTVLWLDSASRPTRGEYYFSSIALDGPGSRLSAIRTEISEVSSDRSPSAPISDPTTEVPWLGHEPGREALNAYYRVEVPRSKWSQVSGLASVLEQYTEPVLLTGPRSLQLSHHRALLDLQLRDRVLIRPDQVTPNRFPKMYRFSLALRGLRKSDSEILGTTEPNVSGVLFFSLESGEPREINVSLRAGPRVFNQRGRQFWTSRATVYEPNSGNIFLLGFTSFSNRLEDLY